MWRRRLVQNAASIFEKKKAEPASPKPVFVWPITLHKQKIAKWKRKRKDNSIAKLFSLKTEQSRKQLLFATRPPYPDRYIAGLPESEQIVANFIYETHMEKPWMGAAKMSSYARMHGYSIGVKRIRTLFKNRV